MTTITVITDPFTEENNEALWGISREEHKNIHSRKYKNYGLMGCIMTGRGCLMHCRLGFFCVHRWTEDFLLRTIRSYN